MHNNNNNAIPLTKEHYMAIGEPRGKTRKDNPRGYSKSQNKILNAFLSMINSNRSETNSIKNKNEKNVSSPFDSWGNPTAILFRHANSTTCFIMAAFY